MWMIRRCMSTAIIVLLHLGMLSIKKTCTFDICDWIRRNALKLNEDET